MAEDKKNVFDGMFDKVKDFAGEAAKKTTEFVADLGDKIGDGIEVAKNKVETEKIEYAINKKMRELGVAYYNNLKNAGANDIDAIVAAIDALYVELEAVDNDDAVEEAAEEVQEAVEEIIEEIEAEVADEEIAE